MSAVVGVDPSGGLSDRALRPKPLMTVSGGRGRASLASIRELWIFREVLGAFVVRQVKVKYKQAAIGLGWSVLQPLIASGLFALFIGRVAKFASEGEPFFLFALCGMVIWTVFSNGASTSMESLVTDQVLLRKVYFPREILPIASVLAALFDFVPALLTLIIASFLFGIAPSITWLALPLPIIIVALAATVCGVALSGLNVYYRDIRYALPFLLQLGLFASPVIYSLGKVPGSWRTYYAIINPLGAAIDGLRRIILHHEWPAPVPTFGALGWLLVTLAIAYWFFKRLERGFADRV
jgi:lipopolysaccharide transport system permease protein